MHYIIDTLVITPPGHKSPTILFPKWHISIISCAISEKIGTKSSSRMNSESDASEHDPAATSTASGAAGKDIISGHHDPVVHEIEHHAKRHIEGVVPRWLSFSIEKKDLRYKVEAIGESNILVMYAVNLDRTWLLIC